MLSDFFAAVAALVKKNKSSLIIGAVFSETIFFIHSYMLSWEAYKTPFFTSNPWFTDVASLPGALGVMQGNAGWLASQLACLLLTLAAAGVCSLFSLEKVWQKLFASAALLGFPALASAMSQSPVVFSASLCAGVFAAVIIKSSDKTGGLIASALLGAVCLWLYPANVSVLLTLMGMSLVISALSGEISGRKILRSLISLTAGVIVYIAAMLTLLAAVGKSVGQSYIALGITSLTPARALHQIPAMYVHLFRFFTGQLYLEGGYVQTALTLIFAAAGIALLIFALMKQRGRNAAWLVIITALLPLFMAVGDFVSTDKTRYFANAYSYAFLIPLLIVLMKKSGFMSLLHDRSRAKKALCTASCALLCLTVFNAAAASTAYYSCVASQKNADCAAMKGAVDNGKFDSASAAAVYAASIGANIDNKYTRDEKPFGIVTGYRRKSVAFLARYDSKYLTPYPDHVLEAIVILPEE